MSLSIRFSLDRPLELPLTGFDLGHIEISTGEKTWSSIGKQPDQAMMIFLSITDLLDGLRQFFERETLENFEWWGTDSSFCIQFKKVPGGDIQVAIGQDMVGSIGKADLASVIFSAVSIFIDYPDHQLAEQDPALGDLMMAINSFRVVTAAKQGAKVK